MLCTYARENNSEHWNNSTNNSAVRNPYLDTAPTFVMQNKVLLLWLYVLDESYFRPKMAIPSCQRRKSTVSRIYLVLDANNIENQLGNYNMTNYLLSKMWMYFRY
jgi:hypothetical protein